MQVIHKQTLSIDSRQTIQLPTNSKIISAANQKEDLCIWYICDTETKEQTERTILMVGTGHPILESKSKVFIDTVLFMSGSLVFHVFEELL